MLIAIPKWKVTVAFHVVHSKAPMEFFVHEPLVENVFRTLALLSFHPQPWSVTISLDDGGENATH